MVKGCLYSALETEARPSADSSDDQYFEIWLHSPMLVTYQCFQSLHKISRLSVVRIEKAIKVNQMEFLDENKNM